MQILGVSTADALCAFLNLQFSGGYIDIYSGTPPTTGDGATSDTLLATIPLPMIAFTNNAGTGTATLAGTWYTTVTTSGTASWWRLRSSPYNSSSITNIIGSISTTSGAPMVLTTLNLVANQVVQLTSFTLTIPLGS